MSFDSASQSPRACKSSGSAIGTPVVPAADVFIAVSADDGMF